LMVSDSEAGGELTRLVTMGLLDTTGRGSRFASSLGGKLLARRFATSALKTRLATTMRSDDESNLPCERFAWYEPLRWMLVGVVVK
jgi:hypothetical protein